MSTKRVLGQTSFDLGYAVLTAWTVVSSVHTFVKAPITSTACGVGAAAAIGTGVALSADADQKEGNPDPSINVTGK